MTKKTSTSTNRSAIARMFSIFSQRQFAKTRTVIGDETLAYYFETVKKFGNEIWLTKYCRNPVVAKRTINVKKVLLKKKTTDPKKL